jgi:nucleotide-binding universal stress UspA family protein
MYRSIVVPLDGSTFAEQALPLAAVIAGRTRGTIHLLRSHVCYLEVYEAKVVPFDPARERAWNQLESEYLEDVSRRLRNRDIHVTTHLDQHRPAEAITNHAREHQADVVIMTTHGLSPFSRFWLGSVTDSLVRSAPVPLLLVRPREGSTQAEQAPVLRRILVPLDGSALSKQALLPATALASLMGATLLLLRAVAPARLPSYEPAAFDLGGEELSAESRVRAEPQYELDEIAERLRDQQLIVQTHVAVGRHPVATILDEIVNRKIDLVALSTHGRGGLSRAVLGSVADKLVRGASVPVLLTRTHADSKARAE